MNSPVSNAISIFRSQIDRCLHANEENFLLELSRLVETSNGNSHIQRCISEINQHGNKWAIDFNAKSDEAQGQIIKFKDFLITKLPEVEQEEEKGDIPEFHPTITHFNKLLSGERKPGIPLDPDPYDDPSINRKLFRVLHDVICRQFPNPDERPDYFKEPLYEIDNKLKWLNNERLNFVRSHPGVLWAQIQKAVEEINPHPKPYNDPIDFNNLMFEASHGLPFRKVLYGWRSKYSNVAPSDNEKASYKSWKGHITDGLKLIESEINVRLTTRISSEWAIKKYVARTSIYRYSEIRRNLDQFAALSQAKGKTLKLEAYLVDDAAAFLFDMGFGVLTERHLAAGRLDIYEETLGVEAARDALLVEAKIYKSASDGKAALKKGLSQIYGYASSIESSFHSTENYLLLFRLAGPKLVIPREPVNIGEYSFRIVHVDLARSDVSGSRSQKPVLIDVEKIIGQIKKTTKKPNKKIQVTPKNGAPD